MKHFKIVRNGKNSFTIYILAKNSKTIATTGAYTRKANGVKAINSIIKAVAIAEIYFEENTDKGPKFELYKDKSGYFRFRLRAINKRVLLSSEPYKTRCAALNGIKSIKKNAISPEYSFEDRTK